jgi:hypothetical protein
LPIRSGIRAIGVASALSVVIPAAAISSRIESVQVEFGPANGPHYQKTEQVVVLTGCAESAANCVLAKKQNLVGMEVAAVDGAELRSEKGMVAEILAAFPDSKAPATIALTFYARAADDQPVEVKFPRR